MSLYEFKILIFAMAVMLNILSSKSLATDQTTDEQTPLREQSFEFSRCPNIDNSIFLIQKNVECEILNRLLSIHQNVQKISPVLIPLSRVIISKKDHLFQSVSFSNLLKLTEEESAGQNIEQKNILLIHELGHMIFNNLLSQDFEEHKNLVIVSNEESNKIWSSLNQNISPSLIDRKVADFILTYHELFADFVTVVYTKDFDATYSAFDKNNSKNDSLKRLSFLKKNQNDTCEDWQHFYFSYSRPIIANKFLINISTLEEKKKAILNFYKFIAQVMIENWKKSGAKINCQNANQELIEKLTSQ